MSARRPRGTNNGNHLGTFKLVAADWAHVKQVLALSPQQARIVALMLQGKKDKQIARTMKIRVPTVRTYLSRMFERTDSADRVELLVRVFACVYRTSISGRRRSQRQHK